MEERIMSTRPFGVEAIHPFRTGENSVNNYDTPASIRHSPPLTYENTRQYIDAVDRSFTHDLPPSRHPGSLSLSAALKIPKLPLNGRSRPLPIPVHPRMSPADGLPVVLSPPAVPAFPTNLQRPPVAPNSQRSRPLPQPGIIPISAAPSTLPSSAHLSSSQTSSFLSSSYTSHSRSGSSNSNIPSHCTAASYSYPHSSSSYQTSFARASTLPTIQNPRNQMTQDGLGLPRRAETQPSSAPPCQAAFDIVAAIAPRNLQEAHAFNVLNSDARGTGSVEDGKARPILLGAGNKSAAQSEIAVENQMDIVTFVLEDSAVLSTPGITTATPEIPSPAPLNFAMGMSPMPPLSGFKSESSGRREETTIIDQVTDVGNELGLSGMSKEDASNTARTYLPPEFQLPPPPTRSPPVPPPRETLPTQRTTTMPPPAPVSLKPLNGGPNLKKKNRPVLAVRTWDLDSKKEHKRTARATALAPNYQNGKELKVPSTMDQVHARKSLHPSVTVSRIMQDNSRASFLPSMGSLPNQGGSPDGTASALMVPVWGDAEFARGSMLLGPGIPAHLESTPPKSSGGLATQFKKMKLLHRKSKSITEWTRNGTVNMAQGALQERPGATKSAVPNATMSQSRSLFGHRHPYGYQRGAATCSLTSVGASVPTASASSMAQSAAPRPDTLHVTAPAHAPVPFLPSHQPKRSPPFRMAPPPPSIPAESKKTIGALWTKLRSGSTWKTTGTASRKKSYGVDLW